MSRKLHVYALGTAVAASLWSCSKKSTDKEDGDDTSSGIFAPGQGSKYIASIAPQFSISSPVGSTATSAALTEKEEGEDLDSEDPRKAHKATEEIAEATEIKQCLHGISRGRVNKRNADCYGPTVWVTSHHPDGTWPSSEPNMMNLPRGDLGFWEEKESATDEACAASKMNALVASVKEQVSEGMEMAVRAGCIAHVLGTELPSTVGDKIDLTADANTALGNHIDKLKFTTMTITLVGESGDVKTYKTEVEAAHPRGTIWTRVVQKSTSATETEGYLWGIFTPKDDASANAEPANPPQGGAPNAHEATNHAFSVLFKTNGSDVTYEATKSRVDDSEIESDKAAVFDDDKRVRVHTTERKGYDHIYTTMNNDTLAGETVYLWTAGSSQEEQRVMHVKVTGEGDTRVGNGYFGYGAKLGEFRTAVKDGTLAATATSIEKMICNWAGPSNNHTGTGVVQKQVLAFDATTGYFNATESHIGYAARNDCGASGADTAFKWARQTDQTRPSESSFQEWPAYDLSDLDEEKDNLTLPTLMSISF